MSEAGGGGTPGRREGEPDWVVRPVPREAEPARMEAVRPEPVRIETPRPGTVLEFGTPPGDRPRRRWAGRFPLLIALVLVAAFVAYQVHRSNLVAAPAPSTPATTSAPPSTPAAAPASASTVPAPVASDVGHALLGATSGWELIGLGAEGVVRIQPAAGRITRTPLPPLNTTGPVSLVAGPNWTMVRPLDSVVGYLVPDGQPARELTGELSHGGPVAPGPDDSSVWIIKVTSSGPVMTLIDTQGQPAGPTLAFPRDGGGQLTPDGTGYLIFEGIGGAYDVRPDGLRRITTGAVVAVGPTRWLALECDDAYRCTTVAIDRRTGARRTLSAPSQAYRPFGVISADGARAAFFTTDPAGLTVTHLVDIASGEDRVLPLPSQVNGDSSTLAWSPDGRWLFVASPTGTLYTVEAATGQVRDLGVHLPPVSQIVVRPAPLS
jgi:hypothetical protein